jgi:AraC family transcriptional activator of mar-sox-rob regulon
MNTGAFIHDLLDWIDNNLESRLDIDTVSRRAGYSKWHLQRIFKEHTGIPSANTSARGSCKNRLSAYSDEPILNVAIALGLTPSNPSIAASSASMARRRGLAPQHGNGSIVPASRLIVGGISSGSAGLTAGECALLFLCRRLTGCRRRAFYADPDF